MKHLCKIIIAFTLVFFSLVLQGCSGVVENENFDTDGYILIGGQEKRPEYVMKIGENSVSLAEYRYYYLNQKFELDGGDDSVWEDYPEYEMSLREMTENTLLEVYSIRNLSQEYGVEPDFEAVSTTIKEFRDSMSSSDYKKGLKEHFLTETLYEYILQGYDLYTTLFDHLFGKDGKLSMTDVELFEYLEDNYTRVKHILIYPNTTMTDEDYSAHLQTVLTRAKSDEDFDALIDEYSNDTAMPEYGYYFTESEMPEAFESVAKELEIGEVSDIVTTSHGYHVIKRLPIDDQNLTELADVVYNDVFSDLIEAEMASVEVTYADEYDYITPKTLK